MEGPTKEDKKQLSIMVVSDTHGEMRSLNKLMQAKGDIFIHAGDFTDYGKQGDFKQFFKLLQRLNFKHKIVIAGNHQISLDNGCISAKKKDAYLNRHKCRFSRNEIIFELKKRCIYLEHQPVEIEGVTIFGSPYTPYYVGNAFQYRKWNEKTIWDAIPPKVDLLVTHCPPFGIRDFNSYGKSVGSEYLRDKVFQINPKYHIFGHIHESPGLEKHREITFINAAMNPTRIYI